MSQKQGVYKKSGGGVGRGGEDPLSLLEGWGRPSESVGGVGKTL